MTTVGADAAWWPAWVAVRDALARPLAGELERVYVHGSAVARP